MSETSRIATRTCDLEAEGSRWTVEVEGSSYIGGGSHQAARLLSLIFRSAEGGPQRRGPVYVVARDLGEVSEDELLRLFQSGQDVMGGSKETTNRHGRSQKRRIRPKGV